MLAKISGQKQTQKWKKNGRLTSNPFLIFLLDRWNATELEPGL